MSDQLLPSTDWRQDWLNHYNVAGTADVSSPPSDLAGEAKSRESGWSWKDTMESAASQSEVDKSFKTDTVGVSVAPASSSGVRVYGGRDPQGQPVYGEIDGFPYWIAAFGKDRLEVPQTSESDEAKKSAVKAETKENYLSPMQALFAATRRLVYPPFQRLGKFLARAGNRFLLRPLGQVFKKTLLLGRRALGSVLQPLQRGLQRIFNFAQSVAQVVREPILQAAKSLGRGVKKVLDTLILDAPSALIKGVSKTRNRLATVLERFANWLRS